MGQVQPFAEKNSPSSPQNCGLLRYFELERSCHHRRIIPFSISNAYENPMKILWILHPSIEITNLTHQTISNPIKSLNSHQSPWHSPFKSPFKTSFFSFEKTLSSSLLGGCREATVLWRWSLGTVEGKARKFRNKMPQKLGIIMAL